MDLGGRLDQVLKMCAGQEISQADEFAVVLVFHIDHTPSVLATSYGAAPDNNIILGANDSKGDQAFNGVVHGAFLLVLLFIVVGIHPQVVEGKFLLYTFLEGETFLERQRV